MPECEVNLNSIKFWFLDAFKESSDSFSGTTSSRAADVEFGEEDFTDEDIDFSVNHQRPGDLFLSVNPITKPHFDSSWKSPGSIPQRFSPPKPEKPGERSGLLFILFMLFIWQSMTVLTWAANGAYHY